MSRQFDGFPHRTFAPRVTPAPWGLGATGAGRPGSQHRHQDTEDCAELGALDDGVDAAMSEGKLSGPGWSQIEGGSLVHSRSDEGHACPRLGQDDVAEAGE